MIYATLGALTAGVVICLAIAALADRITGAIAHAREALAEPQREVRLVQERLKARRYAALKGEND